MPAFGHAAGRDEVESTRHEDPQCTSQQELIKAALRVRSKVMFSGESGAAVASGIKKDAATATTASYGLVRAAMELVFSELDDALTFDAYPPWPRVVRRRRRVLCVNGGMVPPDELPLYAASDGAQLAGRLEIGLLSPHPAAAF